jgi:hypothetical protein
MHIFKKDQLKIIERSRTGGERTGEPEVSFKKLNVRRYHSKNEKI